jgi:GntR family transcriptional regulator
MENYINKQSVIPYYIQLKNIILKKINKGEYPDDKIDSEHKLSRDFDITISTVRKALSELKNDGLIYKVKGVGTFIRKQKIDMDISKFLTFGKILKEKGFSESIKVLKKVDSKFNKDDFSNYKIDYEGRVFIIERVRNIDNEPIALEKFIYNSKIFENIEEKVDSVEIYKYLTDELNIKLTKVEEFIEPVNLRPEESKILQTDENSAALLVNEVIYGNNEWLILVKTIIRGDKCRYHLKVK